MSALALLVRRSVRANRRGVLGLALVIALAGGIALTSLAAARRTDSAFSRYREANRVSDVAMNVVSAEGQAAGEIDDGTTAVPSAQVREAARDLPEVASAASYIGLESVAVLDDQGELVDYQPEVIGSIDGRFLRQDRVAVSEGRPPDPGAADEVFLNEQLAQALGARTGSTVHLAIATIADVAAAEDPSTIVPIGQVEARAVGIGRLPDEVLSGDFDGTPRLLVTPAFTRQWQDVAGSYIWQGLRLAPGSSADEAIVAYERLLPPGLAINVQRGDAQRERVQRAVRPVAVALAAFGLASALAALALGGLGVVRLIAAARGDADTLRGLGLGPTSTTLAIGAGAALASVLGAIGALGIAWALSPLAPVGPVRQVEPARGADLDGTVLLLGGAALLVLLLLIAAVVARQSASSARLGRQSGARPSRLVARFAALGFGPSAVVGARHAMGDGSRGGPPARSTLAACTLAVIAIAAALTFGASVRALVQTPARYGWDATVAVQAGGGYDAVDLDQADAVSALPGVDGVTFAGFAPMSVGDERVNAIGILPGEGEPSISVVRGRIPTQDDEVALGAVTARDLDVGVGDELRSAAGTLQVTGIVALPAFGPLASAHPSLGQGALLTLDGLARQDGSAYASTAFLRLRDGLVGTDRGEELVGQVYGMLTGGPPFGPEVYLVQRPSEVIGLQPATRTANLLAGVLAGAAVLALALSLSASVRRRASTFAVLTALGFSRRDLRRTVRWHTNLVIVLALAIGLPLGVALGRTAWTAFADDLGAAGGPRVPLLLIVGTAAGLLALANAIGEWPARLADRVPARTLADRV